MSDIATAPQGALVTADDFGGGFMVEGRDEGGINLSRVVLFQGTADEEARYGSHKRGVWLDALESRDLGTSIRVMPVFSWAQYYIWEQGQKSPSQTWERKSDVPPDMLKWGETPDGKPIKPEVKEAINIVCIVQRKEGDAWVTEPWPYKLTLKSTGLAAFNKTIGPIEGRRTAMKKVPGLYELGSTDDKNSNGQPFKRLSARPVGDPPEEVVKLALLARSAKDAVRAKANAMEDDADGFNPDAH